MSLRAFDCGRRRVFRRPPTRGSPTKRIVSLGLGALTAVGLVAGSAAPALAVSKGSLTGLCSSYTRSSNQTSATAVCDVPGSRYYFQVQCSWYSAGHGGSQWVSSRWTNDRSRATAICPGGSYVTAFGKTIYYY